jgi:Immunity protein 52
LANYIHIAGRWGTRPEDLGTIARRLARWLTQLREIELRLGRWRRRGLRHRSVVPSIVTMPPDEAELLAWIAENPVFKAQDGRKVTIGHTIDARTPADAAFSGSFTLSAGNGDSRGLHANIGITWFPPRPHEEELIGIVRAVVLATAAAWDCEWVGAMPGTYAAHDPGAPLPKILSGWMVYLDETRAARFAPPEGIMIDQLPREAVLLTTAPGEVFDDRNEAHRSAAAHLQAVLNQL